ncbi:MAG TPA: hypothetical protein VMU04_10885 [Candidatus Acidoferrum sp.]|nr:hypothetical protein [Candidatus Acidoferrum sp.]
MGKPPARRLTQLLIVLGGIVFGQVLLYGPSLAGRKILLPLDILAEDGTYLPRTPEVAKITPQNDHLLDQLCYCEPSRRFEVSELHAGRLPMWAPYHFAGVPFIWPKFSPLLALGSVIASPKVLAWSQLLAAIVAGVGAYLFCRRALGVSFWPGAVAGWCYPMTGFLVLWQGWPTSLAVYWLPCILLAVDRTVRGAGRDNIQHPTSNIQHPMPELSPHAGDCVGPSPALKGTLSPSDGERERVRGTASRIGCWMLDVGCWIFPRFLWRAAPVGLAVVTCLVLLSGHLDVAGQVLMVSGLYALWCLYDTWSSGRFRRALLKLAAGWALGFLLAAPYLLPTLEYTRTGERMARRSAGQEERPPMGWTTLLETVVPDMYGTDRSDTLRIGNLVQVESAAGAYTGVLAALVFAPLAWCNRRERSRNVFWVLLFAAGLSWCVGLPGVVQFLRLPGLNMFSHNRLVFASSFALLALMAVGLNVLAAVGTPRRGVRPDTDASARRPYQCEMPGQSEGAIEWRRWFWFPAALLACLCAWCGHRVLNLPEPIATLLANDILQRIPAEWVHDMEGVRQVQAWYARHYAAAAAWCGIGLAAWLVLWWRTRSHPSARAPSPALRGTAHASRPEPGRDAFHRVPIPPPQDSRDAVERVPTRWLFPVAAALAFGDLLWFAHGRSVQCDPALYFPPVPVLDAVAHSAPGRVIGYNCLPASIVAMRGLHDIRGYDSVDPARLVDLLALAAGPESRSYTYALTQDMAPRKEITPHGELRLPPVLDMLGVRYVIGRGAPPPDARPAFQGMGYWALVNSNALPRAFVPRRVEMVTGTRARLEKLASPQFDPREMAYVESPVSLPGESRGSARIVEEIPTRVTVSVRMETPGMVVLADLWDTGWRAYWNGHRVPILRANHAVRGVVLPAGEGTLVFRYAPASFAWGLGLAGLAVLVLVGWAGLEALKR